MDGKGLSQPITAGGEAVSPLASLWAVALMGSLVLSLSILSGFHMPQVDAGVLWKFSPLGLLRSELGPYAWLPANGMHFGPAGLSGDYAWVFLKTCLLETPFYFLWFRRSRKGFLFHLSLANLLTHPLVFFVIPTLFGTYLRGLLVAEAFAAGAEGAYFFALSPGRRTLGFLIAVAANLFSWQMGAC
jgi:hypothetical protein